MTLVEKTRKQLLRFNLEIKGENILEILKEFTKIKSVHSKQKFDAVPLSESAKMLSGKNLKLQPYICYDGPILLGDNVRIGPYSLLRGPLFLGDNVKIGPHCEITRSIILENTTVSHKNIIPDSFIANDVWLAGFVTFCNTRLDGKFIGFNYEGSDYKAQKLGSIVENGVSLGVSVVAMPGTYIKKDSKIVGPATLSGVVE